MVWLYVTCGICGGLALIFAFIWANNSLLKTTRYKLKVEGLSRGVRIVHLSDLHGKSFGRGNARLIARVLKEQPDFIAVTGDIIHRYGERNKRVALRLVSSIEKIAPVLYVSGNHEMRNKGYRFFRRDLIEAGATVLDDCSVDICGLTVAGLNCASQKNGTVFKLLPEDKAGCKVLLAHKPQFLDEYAPAGYDVILCGHAHGGQWRIPFTDIGFYSPGQGILPKLTSGVHTRGKTREVISRGLGNSECPLRLFNRPEIVTVDLE